VIAKSSEHSVQPGGRFLVRKAGAFTKTDGEPSQPGIQSFRVVVGWWMSVKMVILKEEL
jgi:hypothetical protein